MRYPLLLCLALLGTALAGEPAYPLWDGHESIEQYAKKVILPPTKTLDLGNGVKLELVLIPAGKFIMGTPEPVPVDEDGFQRKILTGQALLAASGGILAVLLAFVVIKAIRKRQRPKYSLLWLLAMTAMAGVAVLSGVRWRNSVQAMERELAEFQVVKARFDGANSNEKPAHSVTLTKAFYFGKFVVTQEQWQQLTGENRGFQRNAKPADWISWEDAKQFCKVVSEKANVLARLPTEAEWEYACRAGTRTLYYSGDKEDELARVAWFITNSRHRLQSVGQLEPNGFGLYDMHGNIFQWCQDLYGEDYYDKSEAQNPQGPTTGDAHVVRGSAWYTPSVFCRSTIRSGASDARSNNVGLRVVVEPAFKAP